jgi:hypothetical protein
LATTALTIVNNVLARLRETQATSSTFSTTYPQLILRFVNETKQEVEAAWDWTSLRSTKTVTTASGTSTYTVTGVGQRYRFYDRRKIIWNATNRTWIIPAPQGWFEEAVQTFTVNNAIPNWYRLTGSDSNLDPTLGLYPTPDGIYSLKLPLVVPEVDMVASTDTFTVHALPVELGAWARAISERGEDGGTGTAEQWQMYRACLADYIAIDGHHVEDELIWEVC